MTRTRAAEDSGPPPSYSTVGDNGVPPPPPESTIDPINVVIVGESQQGKSLLIKSLCRYAGVPDVHVPIGFGNVRCTTSVNRYDVDVILQSYCLLDPQGNEIKDLSYTAYCDLADDDATVTPVPLWGQRQIRFIMTDTPGLDDSQGDDFDHMASIIGTVGSMPHVNAIVYVRQMGRPFSASFKQFFSYIQRCMPALSNGLIIVNTNFTVDRNEQHVSRNEDLAKARREAFTATTGLDLPHFFMDNEPYNGQPFAVMESLNEMYRLLTYLSAQIPLPTTGLKLLKTAQMKSYDAHIVNALLELKNKLETQWAAEKSQSTTVRQTAMANQREISRTEKLLEQKCDQLDELTNGGDIHLGSKTCIEEFSFVDDFLLGGSVRAGKRVLEFHSPHEITRVSKTCSSSSRWLDEERLPCLWRGVLAAKIFRDIDGFVSFYTTSKLKNRAQINTLEPAISELKHSLEDLKASAVREQDIDEKIARLGDDIESIEQLVYSLKLDTFTIDIWPHVRSLYLSNRRPSWEDAQTFVSAFDKHVATLLRSVS